ncbi:hypothetical protein ES702_06831 [subsurface metagenome]
MSIQIGIPPGSPPLVHDHSSIEEGGKLSRYREVFNELEMIEFILADHNKNLHDAMNIDADTVDGEHSNEIVTTLRVENTFPNWNPNVHSKAVHDALALAFASLDLTGHNKTIHDALAIDADKVDGLHASEIVVKSKVIFGTRDLSAAAGDVNYTGVPFPPKAAIFVGAMVGSSVHIMGIGFSDGVTDRMIFTQGYDATLSEDTSSVLMGTVAAGNQSWATVKEFITDGVTLTWGKAGSPTGTLEFGIILLG